MAKRCVLEQQLLLTARLGVVYEKSIGTKMNDLDLCLEVVLRSTVPHIGHDILETVGDRGFVPKDH